MNEIEAVMREEAEEQVSELGTAPAMRCVRTSLVPSNESMSIIGLESSLLS